MELNLTAELIVIAVTLLIAFLLIKLGITQDELAKANRKIKALEETKAMLLREYGNAFVQYQNVCKELKEAKRSNPTPKPARKKKDLNQALNEMNKHAGK